LEFEQSFGQRRDFEEREPQRPKTRARNRFSERFHKDTKRSPSHFITRDQLINFVVSLATFYIPEEEDIETLEKLITKDDRYVMAAIQIFEEDKDQDALLDTLVLLIKLGNLSHQFSYF